MAVCKRVSVKDDDGSFTMIDLGASAENVNLKSGTSVEDYLKEDNLTIKADKVILDSKKTVEEYLDKDTFTMKADKVLLNSGTTVEDYLNQDTFVLLKTLSDFSLTENATITLNTGVSSTDFKYLMIFSEYNGSTMEIKQIPILAYNNPIKLSYSLIDIDSNGLISVQYDIKLISSTVLQVANIRSNEIKVIEEDDVKTLSFKTFTDDNDKKYKITNIYGIK
jgi:hypothetical protein